MLSYIKYIFIFLTLNLFADLNWTKPVAVTGNGGTPDLSDGGDGRDATNSQIATDASGKYVYAIWTRFDGLASIIQTVRSSDFGVTWVKPVAVTGNGGTPNLSDNNKTAVGPQITTDASGKYVYAIWARFDGITNVIQTVKSSDFGVTWIKPTTVTGNGGTPNLSNIGFEADEPQIATDASGRYVYAIWRNVNVIQSVKSSNFGVTWTKPTTVTGNGGTPDLSDDLGTGVGQSQIATDASGRYVYAIWTILDLAGNFVIQSVKSSDFGVTWTKPTTVTGNGGTPDLSDGGRDALLPQIITDASGRYVYAIWKRFNGTANIIQSVKSSDFGVTWIKPTTVTGNGGTPDLSDGGAGRDADFPQITTDETGRYVYAIWSRFNGTTTIIQSVKSSDFGVTWTKPTTVTGNGGTPNLSNNGTNASVPQIATDASGRYVYAIWRFGFLIQNVTSSDFGVTWIKPTTVTGNGGTPNLSDSGPGLLATNPQITTNSSGRFVYAIWERFNGGNYVIQAVNGLRTSSIHFPVEIKPKR